MNIVDFNTHPMSPSNIEKKRDCYLFLIAKEIAHKWNESIPSYAYGVGSAFLELMQKRHVKKQKTYREQRLYLLALDCALAVNILIPKYSHNIGKAVWQKLRKKAISPKDCSLYVLAMEVALFFNKAIPPYYPDKGEQLWKSLKEQHDITQVHTLDLRGMLTTCPTEIFELTGLTYLDLSDNPLKSLPSTEELSLFKLTKLHSLFLKNCQLTSFAIPLSNECLPKMEQLDLSNNQLSCVPPAVCKMRKLKELNLSNNRLTSIDESANFGKEIQIINLRSNRINDISLGFHDLPHLFQLNLNDNQIESAYFSSAATPNIRALTLPLSVFVRNSEQISQLAHLRELILTKCSEYNGKIPTRNLNTLGARQVKIDFL